MNLELILKIILVAIGSSYISTKFLDRIKKGFELKNKILINVLSIITSMSIGIIFCLSFSDLTLQESIWCGLFAVIGAESLYQSFIKRFNKKEVE